MVELVVYFESLHRAVRYASQAITASHANTSIKARNASTACLSYAVSNARNASTACLSNAASNASVSKACDFATQLGGCCLDEAGIEELRLRYEHGLDLLLNAADLEVSCMAIFCEQTKIDALALESALGESLVKKLKQLDLYEIPAYALKSDLHSAEDTVSSHDLVHLDKCSDLAPSAYEQILDFVKTITPKEFHQLDVSETVRSFSV